MRPRLTPHGRARSARSYAPPLKRAVEDILGPGLPVREYPFAGPVDVNAILSAREGATTRANGAKASGDVPVPVTGRRLVVFALGGLCYSELRAMHEAARVVGREIVVGSTSMLTPQTYLILLKAMKQLEPSLV